MIKKNHFLVFLILASLVFGYFTITSFQSEKAKTKKPSSLQIKGDFCAGIAENAIANLPTIVEFQRLEMLARKANVMKHCMTDQGFTENPAWLDHAYARAHRDSVKLNISEDEALQNLRKQDMFIFNQESKSPLYWQKVH